MIAMMLRSLRSARGKSICPTNAAFRERQYVARLWTFVVSLEGASLSDRVNVDMLSDCIYDFLLSLPRLGLRNHDCHFERQMSTAHRPVFAGWSSIEIFWVASSRRGLLHASVSE